MVSGLYFLYNKVHKALTVLRTLTSQNVLRCSKNFSNYLNYGSWPSQHSFLTIIQCKSNSSEYFKINYKWFIRVFFAKCAKMLVTKVFENVYFEDAMCMHTKHVLFFISVFLISRIWQIFCIKTTLIYLLY